MKYAHVLNKQLRNYEPYIHKHCLHYKKWKKLIKTNPEYLILHWKDMIHNECQKLDNFLYNSSLINIKNICFFNFNKNSINNTIKDTISCINLNTLYKICKKLHKKLDINSLEYLDELIKNRKYKFTHIAYYTFVDDYTI